MTDPKSWTISELLRVTTDYLREKGIESPRLSAEILLAHQLNLNRVKLYLNFDQPLQDEEVAGFRSFVKRRLKREPLQYITGIQEFWSLEFIVGPHVQIPRPESELLIEEVLALSRHGRLPESEDLKILDLGTGCGALAISLAEEMEGASVWASDVSEEALRFARLNARKHNLQDRIEFRQGDLWSPFAGEGLSFDVIVSNPPYIDSCGLDSLPPEVKDYEPRTALDGGDGGIFCIEKIIREGSNFLKSGGWLLVEMDPDQTSWALKLIEESNQYVEAGRIKDYSHRYRVVTAKKRF
ncbi:MAG: peptide chain release factor N(5)-glutamine methyltransferase [Desulfobacterales bacterium]|nr:peptide chain release factor N(5)-glutamine methyltransferase [Desulfobacterales bacterium]